MVLSLADSKFSSMKIISFQWKASLRKKQTLTYFMFASTYSLPSAHQVNKNNSTSVFYNQTVVGSMVITYFISYFLVNS